MPSSAPRSRASALPVPQPRAARATVVRPLADRGVGDGDRVGQRSGAGSRRRSAAGSSRAGRTRCRDVVGRQGGVAIRSGVGGALVATGVVGRQRDDRGAVDRHRQAVQQRGAVWLTTAPGGRAERGHEQQVLTAAVRRRPDLASDVEPRVSRTSSPRRAPGERRRGSRPSAARRRDGLAGGLTAATRSSTRPSARRPGGWRTGPQATLWTEGRSHRPGPTRRPRRRLRARSVGQNRPRAAESTMQRQRSRGERGAQPKRPEM